MARRRSSPHNLARCAPSSCPFAATILTLVLAAPAAATPVPGASYGGGKLPPARSSADSVMATAAVAADGQSVRLVATMLLRCNGRPGTAQHLAADGRLGPDGRLRLQVPTRFFNYADRRTRPRGRATIDLGFDGATASGTLRFVMSARTGGRRLRCDETFPLTLRAAAPAASPAAPATAGAALFGTSDARWRSAPVPFGIKVSADGRRAAPIMSSVVERCPRGSAFAVNVSPPTPIAADGTFSDRERFTFRLADRIRIRVTFAIGGRFTAQVVTGTGPRVVEDHQAGQTGRCAETAAPSPSPRRANERRRSRHGRWCVLTTAPSDTPIWRLSLHSVTFAPRIRRLASLRDPCARQGRGCRAG